MNPAAGSTPLSAQLAVLSVVVIGAPGAVNGVAPNEQAGNPTGAASHPTISVASVASVASLMTPPSKGSSTAVASCSTTALPSSESTPWDESLESLPPLSTVPSLPSPTLAMEV